MPRKKIAPESQMENIGTLVTEEEDDTTIEDLIIAAKGMAGTNILDGILEEEYNPELSGLRGMITFDKMRRSDAQISAVLLAMELPIRNAYWSIEPAKDENDEVTEEAEEVAQFVNEAIFERMQDGWDNKLHEIITMLPFGFSLFEKVYISD